MSKKLKALIILIAVISSLAIVNWVYQVWYNPAILLSAFSKRYYKSSHSTWHQYRSLFREHSTKLMTPEYLAALAQVESAGNPLVIPPWRWRLTTDLFRIYAPASTSAGLYQYTKPTFKDAKRFCIHQNKVVLSGNPLDLKSCWFNGFYSRFWPSHAIEMTSARLHHYVETILNQQKRSDISLEKKQQLASIIHLCGVGKGKTFARGGFSFNKISKCGSHDTKQYFTKIKRIMKKLK